MEKDIANFYASNGATHTMIKSFDFASLTGMKLDDTLNERFVGLVGAYPKDIKEKFDKYKEIINKKTFEPNEQVIYKGCMLSNDIISKMREKEFKFKSPIIATTCKQMAIHESLNGDSLFHNKQIGANVVLFVIQGQKAFMFNEDVCLLKIDDCKIDVKKVANSVVIVQVYPTDGKKMELTPIEEAIERDKKSSEGFFEQEIKDSTKLLTIAKRGSKSEVFECIMHGCSVLFKLFAPYNEKLVKRMNPKAVGVKDSQKEVGRLVFDILKLENYDEVMYTEIIDIYKKIKAQITKKDKLVIPKGRLIAYSFKGKNCCCYDSYFIQKLVDAKVTKVFYPLVFKFTPETEDKKLGYTSYGEKSCCGSFIPSMEIKTPVYMGLDFVVVPAGASIQASQVGNDRVSITIN